MVQKKTARKNLQWILARRPVGEIRDGDLVLESSEMPVPAAGEVVIENEWLSLDPTNRVWMSDVRQYMPPVPLGAPMRGFTCGAVVASASDTFAVGTNVMGVGTWARYSCVPAANLMPLPEIPGLTRKDVFGQCFVVAPTAYFGIVDIGAPKIGETLVVSGAAGAVGSLAGQFGKALGCTVIGIAGGPAKCDYLVKELGFDHALDYKRGELDTQLRVCAPDGVDVFFDNVGGETLDTVLAQMRLHGRIVQCGMISGYNDEVRGTAPSRYPLVVMQRLRIQGFIVLDYFTRYPEAFRAIAALHARGRLKWRYHDIEGLGQAVDAVRLLYQGGNLGKMMVRL